MSDMDSLKKNSFIILALSLVGVLAAPAALAKDKNGGKTFLTYQAYLNLSDQKPFAFQCQLAEIEVAEDKLSSESPDKYYWKKLSSQEKGDQTLTLIHENSELNQALSVSGAEIRGGKGLLSLDTKLIKYPKLGQSIKLKKQNSGTTPTLTFESTTPIVINKEELAQHFPPSKDFKKTSDTVKLSINLKGLRLKESDSRYQLEADVYQEQYLVFKWDTYRLNCDRVVLSHQASSSAATSSRLLKSPESPVIAIKTGSTQPETQQGAK